MAEARSPAYSNYTDEQLLELASQCDTLLEAGKVALEIEMKRRGYEPSKLPASIAGNYARLFSMYTDSELIEFVRQRHTLPNAGKIAFDEETRLRCYSPKDMKSQLAGIARDGEHDVFAANFISNLFLGARHWQIFLLLFGLYFAGAVLESGGMEPGTVRSLKDIGPYGISGMILTALSMVCFLGWLWSIGLFLNASVHPLLRSKSGLLTFAFAYPGIFIACAVLSLNFFMNSSLWWTAVMLPLILVTIFCVFYAIYFASKYLVLAEAVRPSPFYDYAGAIVLLACYPVGIWIVQPRINRLYRSSVIPRSV